MTLMDAILMLDNLVDESDPDVSLFVCLCVCVCVVCMVYHTYTVVDHNPMSFID